MAWSPNMTWTEPQLRKYILSPSWPPWILHRECKTSSWILITQKHKFWRSNMREESQMLRKHYIRYHIFPRIIRDTDWQQAQEFKTSSYCNINSFCINNKLVQPPAQKTEVYDNLHDMTTPIIAQQGSQDKVSALQDFTDKTNWLTSAFWRQPKSNARRKSGTLFMHLLYVHIQLHVVWKRSRASSCYYSSPCSLSLWLVQNSPAHRRTLPNDILPWKKKVYLQHGTQLEQKLLGASLEEFRAAQHALILDDRLGLHLVGCRMPPSRSHRL